MKVCFSCKRELELEERPGRGDTCPHCGADLRVCLNCRFYDEGAYNSCREPRAERVVDKERASFCDYFEFRESEKDAGGDGKGEAKRMLDELFGGS